MSGQQPNSLGVGESGRREDASPKPWGVNEFYKIPTLGDPISDAEIARKYKLFLPQSMKSSAAVKKKLRSLSGIQTDLERMISRPAEVRISQKLDGTTLDAIKDAATKMEYPLAPILLDYKLAPQPILLSRQSELETSAKAGAGSSNNGMDDSRGRNTVSTTMKKSDITELGQNTDQAPEADERDSRTDEMRAQHESNVLLRAFDEILFRTKTENAARHKILCKLKDYLDILLDANTGLAEELVTAKAQLESRNTDQPWNRAPDGPQGNTTLGNSPESDGEGAADKRRGPGANAGTQGLVALKTELEVQRRELQNEKARHISDVSVLNKQIELLSTSLTRTTQQNKDISIQNSYNKKIIFNYKEQIDILEEETSKLRTLTNEQCNRIYESHEKIERLLSQVDELKKENQEHRRNAEEFQEIKEQAEMESQKARSSQMSLEETLQQQKDIIVEYEKRLDTFKAEREARSDIGVNTDMMLIGTNITSEILSEVVERAKRESIESKSLGPNKKKRGTGAGSGMMPSPENCKAVQANFPTPIRRTRGPEDGEQDSNIRNDGSNQGSKLSASQQSQSSASRRPPVKQQGVTGLTSSMMDTTQDDAKNTAGMANQQHSQRPQQGETSRDISEEQHKPNSVVLGEIKQIIGKIPESPQMDTNSTPASATSSKAATSPTPGMFSMTVKPPIDSTQRVIKEVTQEETQKNRKTKKQKQAKSNNQGAAAETDNKKPRHNKGDSKAKIKEQERLDALNRRQEKEKERRQQQIDGVIDKMVNAFKQGSDKQPAEEPKKPEPAAAPKEPPKNDGFKKLKAERLEKERKQAERKKANVQVAKDSNTKNFDADDPLDIKNSKKSDNLLKEQAENSAFDPSAPKSENEKPTIIVEADGFEPATKEPNTEKPTEASGTKTETDTNAVVPVDGPNAGSEEKDKDKDKEKDGDKEGNTEKDAEMLQGPEESGEYEVTDGDIREFVDVLASIPNLAESPTFVVDSHQGEGEFGAADGGELDKKGGSGELLKRFPSSRREAGESAGTGKGDDADAAAEEGGRDEEGVSDDDNENENDGDNTSSPAVIADQIVKSDNYSSVVPSRFTNDRAVDGIIYDTIKTMGLAALDDTTDDVSNTRNISGGNDGAHPNTIAGQSSNFLSPGLAGESQVQPPATQNTPSAPASRSNDVYRLKYRIIPFKIRRSEESEQNALSVDELRMSQRMLERQKQAEEVQRRNSVIEMPEGKERVNAASPLPSSRMKNFRYIQAYLVDLENVKVELDKISEASPAGHSNYSPRARLKNPYADGIPSHSYISSDPGSGIADSYLTTTQLSRMVPNMSGSWDIGKQMQQNSSMAEGAIGSFDTSHVKDYTGKPTRSQRASVDFSLDNSKVVNLSGRKTPLLNIKTAQPQGTSSTATPGVPFTGSMNGGTMSASGLLKSPVRMAVGDLGEVLDREHLPGIKRATNSGGQWQGQDGMHPDWDEEAPLVGARQGVYSSPAPDKSITIKFASKSRQGGNGGAFSVSQRLTRSLNGVPIVSLIPEGLDNFARDRQQLEKYKPLIRTTTIPVTDFPAMGEVAIGSELLQTVYPTGSYNPNPMGSGYGVRGGDEYSSGEYNGVVAKVKSKFLILRTSPRRLAVIDCNELASRKRRVDFRQAASLFAGAANGAKETGAEGNDSSAGNTSSILVVDPASRGNGRFHSSPYKGVDAPGLTVKPWVIPFYMRPFYYSTTNAYNDAWDATKEDLYGFGRSDDGYDGAMVSWGYSQIPRQSLFPLALKPFPNISRSAICPWAVDIRAASLASPQSPGQPPLSLFFSAHPYILLLLSFPAVTSIVYYHTILNGCDVSVDGNKGILVQDPSSHKSIAQSGGNGGVGGGTGSGGGGGAILYKVPMYVTIRSVAWLMRVGGVLLRDRSCADLRARLGIDTHEHNPNLTIANSALQPEDTLAVLAPLATSASPRPSGSIAFRLLSTSFGVFTFFWCRNIYLSAALANSLARTIALTSIIRANGVELSKGRRLPETIDMVNECEVGSSQANNVYPYVDIAPDPTTMDLPHHVSNLSRCQVLMSAVLRDLVFDIFETDEVTLVVLTRRLLKIDLRSGKMVLFVEYARACRRISRWFKQVRSAVADAQRRRFAPNGINFSLGEFGSSRALIDELWKQGGVVSRSAIHRPPCWDTPVDLKGELVTLVPVVIRVLLTFYRDVRTDLFSLVEKDFYCLVEEKLRRDGEATGGKPMSDEAAIDTSGLGGCGTGGVSEMMGMEMETKSFPSPFSIDVQTMRSRVPPHTPALPVSAVVRIVQRYVGWDGIHIAQMLRTGMGLVSLFDLFKALTENEFVFDILGLGGT